MLRERSVLRRWSSFFVFLLIVAALTSLYLLKEYYIQWSGPLSAERVVIINSGESTQNICKKLAKDNVVRWPWLFFLSVVTDKNKSFIQAGEYSFSAMITPKQVIDKIKKGDVVIHKITIPEGYTTKQITDLMHTEKNLLGDIKTNYLEGELLPGTYYYKRRDSRESILYKMQINMKEELEHAWNNKQDNLPIKDKQQLLILASIIEKETPKIEEYKKVSAVFNNRLRKKMKLQADPTVIYAITLGQYSLPRLLTTKDLSLASPYNTYYIPGLPNAPICNPGKLAIDAAANPLNSEDLYFVVNGEGGHNFAKSLSEHNKYVKIYRNLIKKK